MDGSKKIEREANPRASANFFSKITFFFAYPIFRRGLRKDLNEDDIYEILNNCSSKTLGDKLEKQFEKLKKKGKPHIILALFKLFLLEYALLGLALVILHTAIVVIKPILIGKIVSYFTPKHTASVTEKEAYMYTLILILCVFANIIFIHSYIFALEQLSFRIKISLCTVIYRKSLKLNSSVRTKSAGGQAVTLITKDVNTFDFVIYAIHQVFVAIVQILVMSYVMYKQIGISAYIGTSMLLLFIPLQGYLASKTSIRRLKTAERTDQRVRITQEIFTAMRIIKMYTWELFFSKIVDALRKKEMRNLRILFYIKSIILSIGQLSSRLAFYVCVIVYVALGNHVTAEKAFVVTGCFSALRTTLTIFIPLGFFRAADCKASLQRIDAFLNEEEILSNQITQHFDTKEPGINITKLGITFNNINVLQDINLEIKPGLTMLTGGVGVGKSSLLKVIIGDIKKEQGVVEVSGKISYASQEPWLFPGTVRQNIIFDEEFHEKRYETVVNVCALRQDFEAFPKGDKTRLSDRGLNLSRGQKTRINLARAIYKSADIYLLDDCLSAVDSHVGKHIFYECIKSFLEDKICIFVTHNVQIFKDADNIVLLSKGGVKFQGSFSDLQKENYNDYGLDLNEENRNQQPPEEDNEKKIANESEDVDDSSALLTTAKSIKNIYEEGKEEGGVKKEVYWTYFKSGGGFSMFLLVIFLSILAQAVASWSDYFVSFWVDMEQKLSSFRFNGTTNSSDYEKLEHSHDTVMKQYSFVIISAAFLMLIRAFAFFIFTTTASINVHRTIINKVLNAGMIFFDRNLSGNVLNRFSRDLGILDEQMPAAIFECIRVSLMLFGVLFVVSSVNPYFLIPSAIFAGILYYSRDLYLPTGRSIRRLEGATRSPVIGHLNATLDGLTTIRASQAQSILKNEFDRHQDLYNSVVYMHLTTTRAFAFCLDAMCGIYITIITLSFLFFKSDTMAGKVGLAITQSFSLTGLLQWGVRQWAELENLMTSTERVLEYNKIESEEKLGENPVNWPNYGKIVYENVNLRYSPNTEWVLKDINLVIEPRQKIGIVGRTGAGKSSIISTLYRLYDYEGAVKIDDVDTADVAVEFLRSKLSIIPQDPVLFSGTIRSNLDPNDEYDDKTLWDALEEVEMKKIISDLNFEISENGANFSIGQKQMLCLARAIIRKNVILVLDEATANVDPQTDALMQRIIAKRFSDFTVITIAHRLYTVMNCDMVLVMDSGVIVEYDHPTTLLKRKGMFYEMVKEAGLLNYSLKSLI